MTFCYIYKKKKWTYFDYLKTNEICITKLSHPLLLDTKYILKKTKKKTYYSKSFIIIIFTK